MLNPLINTDVTTLALRIHHEIERSLIGLRTLTEMTGKMAIPGDISDAVEASLGEVRDYLTSAKDGMETALFDGEPVTDQDALLCEFFVEYLEKGQEASETEWFRCSASSIDHAIEQALSAYPEATILSVVLNLAPEVEHAAET